MKRLLPVLALTLLLAGCSTPHSVAVTHSVKPHPSHAAVLKVGVATTCDLLFGPNLDGGPMQDASSIVTRLAANPDGSTITLAEVNKTLDSLKAAKASASDGLVPYIDAESAPLSILSKALSGGPNATISFTDWKAAGIELINRCK